MLIGLGDPDQKGANREAGVKFGQGLLWRVAGQARKQFGKHPVFSPVFARG
jgi:hypothetical protein